MSAATRDKKQEWLEGMQHLRGCRPRDLIDKMIARHGLDWFTDEQIDDLAGSAVAIRRRDMRTIIQNRRFHRQQKDEAA
jgi:hypothetical protein